MQDGETYSERTYDRKFGGFVLVLHRATWVDDGENRTKLLDGRGPGCAVKRGDDVRKGGEGEWN